MSLQLNAPDLNDVKTLIINEFQQLVFLLGLIFLLPHQYKKNPNNTNKLNAFGKFHKTFGNCHELCNVLAVVVQKFHTHYI